MNAKSDPILHMPRWICHKQVNADRIEHVQPASLTEGDASYAATLLLASGGQVRVGQSFVARGWPIKGNYLVQYVDGYLSWSPAQAFEAGYTRIYHPTPVILGQPTLPGAPDRPGPVCETLDDSATDAAIHDRPQTTAPWPAGCLKPGGCERRRACGYTPCPHQHRDIAAEVDSAVSAIVSEDQTTTAAYASGDRWICSPAHPWRSGLPTPVVHPAGREIQNRGGSVTMGCDVCGTQWEVSTLAISVSPAIANGDTAADAWDEDGAL